MQVKLLPATTAKGEVRARVTVSASPVTPKPIGTLAVKFGSRTQAISLDVAHGGTRVVTIARTAARGTLEVRYSPTGTLATQLNPAVAQTAVRRTTPKVTAKVLKKRSSAKRLTVRVKVRATAATAKPRGTVRLKLGSTVRTVKLKPKHKGTITVKIKRPAKRAVLRVRFTPTKGHAKLLGKKSIKIRVSAPRMR